MEVKKNNDEMFIYRKSILLTLFSTVKKIYFSFLVINANKYKHCYFKLSEKLRKQRVFLERMKL